MSQGTSISARLQTLYPTPSNMVLQASVLQVKYNQNIRFRSYDGCEVAMNLQPSGMSIRMIAQSVAVERTQY